MGESEQSATRHKVAIAAVEIVKTYAASLRALPSVDLCEVVETARKARALLKDSALPSSVARVVETALDEMFDVQIASRVLLEESVRQERARADEEREAALERARRDYERELENTRALVGKSATTLLCVVVGSVLALKNAPVWACASLLVLLYVWGYKEPLEKLLKRWKKTR